MERALHASAVVAAKLADGALCRGEVLRGHLGLAEELAPRRGRGRRGGRRGSFVSVVRLAAAEEARLGPAPEVEHDLEQRGPARVVGDRRADVLREGQEQRLEVVADGDGAVLLLEDVCFCLRGLERRRE